MQKDPWIKIAKPKPEASLRLVCCHFAGGGASSFHKWAEWMPAGVELAAAQMPGREGRFREPALQSIHAMAEGLAGTLRNSPRPFALFGHSMGAAVAFETTRTLRRSGASVPVQLFVSGHRAPHRPYDHRKIAGFPDDQFKQEIAAMEGTPPAVLEHQELMDLYLGILRADFAAVESYVYREEPPLDLPITAYAGDQDPRALPPTMAEWDRQTNAAFQMVSLPGHHFFIQEESSGFRDHFRAELARLS